MYDNFPQRALGLIPTSLLLVSLGWSRPASAQDDELTALREQLERQQERLQQVEEQLGVSSDEEGPDADALTLSELLSDVEAAEHTETYGSNSSGLAVHGFLNFEYADADSSDSEFDLHHANMFFAADLGSHAQGWIEVEYEHAGEVVELDQAEIRIFSGDTTVGFGRFYAPFGIERRSWYPPTNAFVSRPAAFRRIVPGNWYETGARLEHDGRIGDWGVQTELAVTNGLGAGADTDVRDARQSRDNGTGKAVIGRIGATPREGLGFGISGATMGYESDQGIDFLGVDVEYARGPWLARAEGVQSRVESSSLPTGDFMRAGLYLQLGREIYARDEESLWISARLDILDGNDDVVDQEDFTAYNLAATWQKHANVKYRLEGRAFEGRHGADLVSDYELLF
ncbi:MAG: hypothetical protein GY711_28015 [bacterium]|nr:hypothetical protein [bacterium]